MGSPVFPIVANLYMEQFEQKALATAPNPPSVWLRYVDNVFTQIGLLFVEEFHQHLNSMDTNIKFTIQKKCDGKLPFLETLVHLGESGKTWVMVYRKATHTDQYLKFGSINHLQHKQSMVEILMNRANKIISKEEDKKAEIRHVRSSLRTNGYQEWMFKTKTKKKDSNRTPTAPKPEH